MDAENNLVKSIEISHINNDLNGYQIAGSE